MMLEVHASYLENNIFIIDKTERDDYIIIAKPSWIMRIMLLIIGFKPRTDYVKGIIEPVPIMTMPLYSCGGDK